MQFLRQTRPLGLAANSPPSVPWPPLPCDMYLPFPQCQGFSFFLFSFVIHLDLQKAYLQSLLKKYWFKKSGGKIEYLLLRSDKKHRFAFRRQKCKTNMEMFSKWQFTKVYMTRGDKDTKNVKDNTKNISPTTDASAKCKSALGVRKPFPLCPASSGTSLVLPSLSELGSRKRLVSRAHLSSELWEEFDQTQFWKHCQYPHHQTTQIISYSHSYGLPLAARDYCHAHTGRPGYLVLNGLGSLSASA